MPARGRRSAKPFTRRRSAAAFRLRPPVPRMNLFPEPRPGGRSGGEAGAARGCSAPAPSRRAAGLAGVGYGCPFSGGRTCRGGVWLPVPAPRFADTFLPTFFSPASFSERSGPYPLCRRPGIVRRPCFFGDTVRYIRPGPANSAQAARLFGDGAAFFCAQRPGPVRRIQLASADSAHAARPFGNGAAFFVPGGPARSSVYSSLPQTLHMRPVPSGTAPLFCARWNSPSPLLPVPSHCPIPSPLCSSRGPE